MDVLYERNNNMREIIISGVEHIACVDKTISIIGTNGCNIQFDITAETTIKLLRVADIHQDQSYIEAFINI